MAVSIHAQLACVQNYHSVRACVISCCRWRLDRHAQIVAGFTIILLTQIWVLTFPGLTSLQRATTIRPASNGRGFFQMTSYGPPSTTIGHAQGHKNAFGHTLDSTKSCETDSVANAICLAPETVCEQIFRLVVQAGKIGVVAKAKLGFLSLEVAVKRLECGGVCSGAGSVPNVDVKEYLRWRHAGESEQRCAPPSALKIPCC